MKSNSALAVHFVLACVVALGNPPCSKAFEVLGVGQGFLLGGDLTDPENDGVDSPEPLGGGGFNWVSITASALAYFDIDNVNPRQGSFDLFDNKVNNGEGKFCCPGAPWNVSVEFAEAYVLTHFTITSNNDSIGRNPDVWQILGSNDGVTWTIIYAYDQNDTGAPGNRLYAGNSVWTVGDQVIRWNGGGVDFPTPPPYKWFRLNADSAAGWPGTGGQLSLAEVEFFGTSGGAAFAITEISTASDNTITLTWDAFAGRIYGVYYSLDLVDFAFDINDNVTDAVDEVPGDGDKITFSFPNPTVTTEAPFGAPALYLRVVDLTP